MIYEMGGCTWLVYVCTSPDETTVWFTAHRIIPVCSYDAHFACCELFDHNAVQSNSLKVNHSPSCAGRLLTFNPKGKSFRYSPQIFSRVHKSMQTTFFRLWSKSQQFLGIRNFPFSNSLNQCLKTYDNYLNIRFFKNLVCWHVFEQTPYCIFSHSEVR